jgi:hypothetical protein
MKKYFLLPAALFMFASSGIASTVCANAGLDFYSTAYAGFANACRIGDKLFYDFSYSAVPIGTAPIASETAVAPDPGDGFTNPGLIFSVGGFLVFPGQTLTATIIYSVATLSGSPVIEDYSLSMAGSHTAQPFGLGSGSVTESFSNNPTGTPLITSVGPDGLSSLSAHADFLPLVSSATVTTVIQLQSPNSGPPDVVTISAIQEHFSEAVPEPAVPALIGSGLLFLGLRRRRANSLQA